MMSLIRSRFFAAVMSAIVCCLTVAGPPVCARQEESASQVRDRLEHGEIVVDLQTIGKMKFVTGRVLIDQPPDKVWPIMVNPFEFQKNISPRMKTVDVLVDKINKSIMKVTLDVFPISDITYVVESTYKRTEHGARIDFHRVGGSLKDFRGHWVMNPTHNGTKTELIYSMYLDPGFYVPKWIVREGIKGELPRTLTALRNRVKSVCEDCCSLERKTILAAMPGRPIQ